MEDRHVRYGRREFDELLGPPPPGGLGGQPGLVDPQHLPGRGERRGHPLGGELAAGERELRGEPGRRQSGLGAVPVQMQQPRLGVGQHREVGAGQPGLHMGPQVDLDAVQAVHTAQQGAGVHVMTQQPCRAGQHTGAETTQRQLPQLTGQ